MLEDVTDLFIEHTCSPHFYYSYICSVKVFQVFVTAPYIRVHILRFYINEYQDETWANTIY
jgi:hypothetical protein